MNNLGWCTARIRSSCSCKPMTPALQLYRTRITTAEQAVEAIQPGMRVFMTGNVPCPGPCWPHSSNAPRRSPGPSRSPICSPWETPDYVAPGWSDHPRQHAVHRLQRAPGRQRRPGGFHSLLPVRNSGPFPARHSPARRGAGPCNRPIPMGSAASASRWASPDRRRIRPDRRRGSQRPHAPHPRDSFIHVSKLTHVVPVSYPLTEHRMGEITERSTGSPILREFDRRRFEPCRWESAASRCRAEIPRRQTRPWHPQRECFRRSIGPGRARDHQTVSGKTSIRARSSPAS